MQQKIIENLRANWKKLVTGITLLVAGTVGYQAYEHSHLPSAGGATLSAEQAFQADEGAQVEFDFTPVSGKAFGSKGVILNGKKYNFDAPASPTDPVWCASGIKGFENVASPDTVIGHKLHVRGTKTTYKGKPEVKATEVSLAK